MHRFRISGGPAEAQYRRSGLLIIFSGLLTATAITLALSGPLRVGATDRLFLLLMVVKNALFLAWLWRRPQLFQLIGGIELTGEIVAGLYRMQQVLLVDHTAHGLSGYSYWLALPYLVASLVLPTHAALLVSAVQLTGLAVLGGLYWADPLVADSVRQDSANAWLQMLLMHSAFLAVITLQQHLRRRYALNLVEAERRAALALRDSLTGLPNRRALQTWLDAQREGCSVVYLDIDHFKRVNDVHGHDVGDSVLRHVAGQARQCVRQGDQAGRWGGEEFLLLIQGDAQVASRVAERLRAQLRAERHPVAGVVTVSCGVAQAHPGESADALLRRADRALYAAKRAGRDTVEVAV
ncbi:GGDEF domain-containing protein [Deinococcus depolymerans]|uniref:GGDEF domain-containing protein n=1 Tax=Deinococcus depolymerans TaxID=392408 RepID=A0ABP3M180_9DEIO